MDERYQLVSGISVKDYQRLRAEVYWAELATEQAKSGLKNAFASVSAVRDGQVVGMARLLWDGGYCAYLTEVMVSFEHRHQGIATAMVERLLAEISAALKPGWQVKVVLMSGKGRESFYTRFGFQERPNERLGAGMELCLKG